MKKYWETRDGRSIEYKDLDDGHLLNILKWIKIRAEEGMTMMSGGGSDACDMWYDEYTIYGNEVLEQFDYQGLIKEAKKRKLNT